MKSEEAHKLTQQLINEEIKKIPEYTKQTVSLILNKIAESTQLGLFKISILSYDYTKHVRLIFHQEDVFNHAVAILVKEYGYKYTLDTNHKSDFHRISWEQ